MLFNYNALEDQCCIQYNIEQITFVFDILTSFVLSSSFAGLMVLRKPMFGWLQIMMHWMLPTKLVSSKLYCLFEQWESITFKIVDRYPVLGLLSHPYIFAQVYSILGIFSWYQFIFWNLYFSLHLLYNLITNLVSNKLQVFLLIYVSYWTCLIGKCFMRIVNKKGKQILCHLNLDSMHAFLFF